MSNPSERARLTSDAARALRGNSNRGGISACGIVGIIVGVAALGMIARSLPDLFRYIRISSM